MSLNHYWDHLISALQGRLPDIPDTESDWESICRLAQQLGVAPLLHHHLCQHGLTDSIPAASREYLRMAYMHAAMHNTRLYHFLKQAVSALAEAGIPVVLLKGAYLAKGVYSNIAIRPMGDADIMVPQDRLLQAAQIAESLGYQPDEVVPLEKLNYRHHLPTYINDAGISLEIHGTPNFMHLESPLSGEEFARVWEDTLPWTMDGSPVRVLSPEDRLLHTCLHTSTGHRFAVDLRPLFDIAYSIEHGGIDWQKLLDRARNWGYLHAVVFTLMLAQRWTGVELPTEVTELIEPGMEDPVLVNYVRRKILAAPRERFWLEFFENGSEEACFAADINPFFCRKGFRFRICFMIESLFPPGSKNHFRRLSHLPWKWCVLLTRWLFGRVYVRSTVKQERQLWQFILR